jgi:translation initiation factor 2 alpha subunit (eIF-2alpha)
MVYLYPNKLPTTDTVVIGKVKEINGYGVVVILPEYNNIEGYIAFSEVSMKKRYKINNIMAIGKEVLLNTITVDEKKQNIDLSKRMINDNEIKYFTDNYKKHLQLFNLWRYIFFKLHGIEINDENILKIDTELFSSFLEKTLWNFQNEYTNEELIEIMFNNDKYDIFNNLENNSEIKEILKKYTDSKIVKVLPQKTLEITLYSFESTGLNDIKYVLNYKTYDNENINNSLSKYSIDIKYMTNSIYNINIKLNNFNDINNNEIDNIDIISSYFLKEIKKRSIDKQIIMN